MDLYEVLLAGLVVVFGSGGIWAWSKVKSETAGTWVEVAEGLRTEIQAADNELREQRRRRHELEEEVNVLVGRVGRLEQWIVTNTDCKNPDDINGEDEELEGTPI